MGLRRSGSAAARALLGLLLAVSGPATWAAAQPGQTSAADALAVDPDCHTLLDDGDFESVVSNWSEESTPALVVLDPKGAGPFDDVLGPPPLPISTCDAFSCPEKLRLPETDAPGIAAPAGPNGGEGTWAWFGGGITNTETIAGNVLAQTLSQPVTLPALLPGYTATLKFNFWISRADAGTNSGDKLEVRLGNSLLFSATAAVTAPYASGYTPVSVDLSAYAGQSATLVFSATTPALGNRAVGAPDWPPVVNFNVDDVRVCVPFKVYLPTLRR